MIMEEEPLLCDACHQGIVGPRIHCLQCPATNLCLTCSENHNTGGNDNRKPAGEREHNANHICRVVFHSEG